jgi:glycosyltransferase involved in cell wall biosynthesis
MNASLAESPPVAMSGPPGLTIFTPTYNRADLLPRLFDSIRRQVTPGEWLEWLVIDDGSTDGTPDLLATFAAERPDFVRHLRVVNGGKHRAINRAAQLAQGDWILVIDSDDLLADGALEHIRGSLASVQDARIGMLRGMRRFPETGQGASHFELPRNPCSHAEWVSTQRGFDTAEILRKSALQAHPFPEHAGERFMAESWLWHNLDKTHLIRFVDHVWVDCFYQPGGLTAQSRRARARSPLSAMDVYMAMYQSQAGWSVRVRAAVNWWRYRFHARCRNVMAAAVPARVPGLFAPAGWLLSRADRPRTSG